MKKYLTVVLMMLLAVSVISATGVVSAKPPAKTLDTPQLLTPADGATLVSGKDMALSWTAVNHATRYTLAIERWDTATKTWQPTGLAQTVIPDNLNSKVVTCTTPFMVSGDMYQWHVKAANSDSGASPWAGATSAWSDWYAVRCVA